MHVEEIYISSLPSDFTEERLPEIRVSNAAIEQSDRFRFSQFGFELFNERFLSITAKELFRNTRSHELDISILDAQPKRSFRIAWGYLLGCLVLAAGAGLIGFSDLFQNPRVLVAILGAGAGLSLLLAIYRSHDRLVFYSQYGGVPLATLLNKRPERNTFKAFTDALVSCIRETRDEFENKNEMLRKELKELRRLMEAGAISDQEYNPAKRRILELYQ